MSEWKSIDTAPLDGTPIQARIPGNGEDNIICWDSDAVEGPDGPCGAWIFASEQEPPDCWTDGYCWEINEDGVRSMHPTHWKEAA